MPTAAFDICPAAYIEDGVTIAPPGSITPGTTPAPTNKNGQYLVVTTKISVSLVFPGKFPVAICTGNTNDPQVISFRAALTSSLSAKVGYPVTLGTLTCGSLIVAFSVSVPVTETATIAAVQSNVQAINSDPTTTWLAAVITACSTCQISAPSAQVTAVTTVMPGTPNPPGPVEQTCGSGCVAGIIIAAVVVIVIITAVTCICVRRATKVDGKDASHEPTTEMSSDPTNV